MNTNLQKFICLLVSIVIVLGFSAILTQRRTDPLERTLSAMSLRDKAAQMMIASFRVWKEVPETEDMEQTGQEPPAVNITALNDEVRALVSRDHFGGMLLFSENFEDAEQTLRLVAELQSTNRSGGGLPQMFFIDQEGGSINRISYSTLGVGNMALAATAWPPSMAKSAGCLESRPTLPPLRTPTTIRPTLLSGSVPSPMIRRRSRNTPVPIWKACTMSASPRR